MFTEKNIIIYVAIFFGFLVIVIPPITTFWSVAGLTIIVLVLIAGIITE